MSPIFSSRSSAFLVLVESASEYTCWGRWLVVGVSVGIGADRSWVITLLT